MRQGQQNRRGRGRGGRKPQNPLARNYESNGPDVKIRGTAAHIAEKYMSLARDALASGDMVSAESYLQHAEHYNRIIMAAQTQFGTQPGGQQSDGPNGGSYRNPRWNSEGSDDDGDGGSDFDTTDGGGGADVRDARGGQDRERRTASATAAADKTASAMKAIASITAAVDTSAGDSTEAAVTSRVAVMVAMAARPSATAMPTAQISPSPISPTRPLPTR